MLKEPKTVEEMVMAVMYDEHVSYKSSKEYLSRLYTKGEHVIQGPGENAGILDAGQGLAIALRMESHNHPSAIEPFRGAATGVGGILRDIFTMGARPIALVDNLRFGTGYRADYHLQGVPRGISFYGNTVGVPVVGGDVYLDHSYNGNPLVNVGCVGLVERKNIIYGNALTPGNDLIYVGAKTGKDGVEGASYASREIDEAERQRMIDLMVQHGDPYLEKLLLEACVELAPTGWVEGMQDMGAAGLLCSTSELAYRGRKKTGQPIGARVNLDLVPAKVGQEDISPMQKLKSESQERMMAVVKREHSEDVIGVFKKWGLEAVIIGKVTNDDHYTLEYSENGQKTETAIHMDRLFPDVVEEWPRKPWVPRGGEQRKASKPVTDAIWHRYDWRVGGRTLKGPNKPGHFAILDLDEIGKELVVSWSSDEGRSDQDAALGVRYAFNKARNYQLDNGAKPLGLTNCLNFGSPHEIIDSFARTTEELGRICRETEIPVVSGNVSLYNASMGRPIKPTPILVMAGIRDKR